MDLNNTYNFSFFVKAFVLCEGMLMKRVWEYDIGQVLKWSVKN